MKHCCHTTNWLPTAIDLRLIVDHITDKCSSAHTWFWKVIYYLYWQIFLLFETRIVTNQEITVEWEWNDKVLKTEGYCIERLNYHGPQFQKQWNGNGQLFCTWWKCFNLQLCIIGGIIIIIIFQVRAVLAVKMRTLRMIQIHGTMHIGVNTALLQVSYWHCGIFYQLIQGELNNFATTLANV